MKIKVTIPLPGGKDQREVEAELLKLKLSEVTPYKNNVKDHPQSQIDSIKASIQKTGFRNPIEVDENNEILSGHGRLLACKQLGMKEVLVLKYSDLGEEEKIAYRLNTNRTADLGSYNVEKLQFELEKINLDQFEKEMYDFAIPDIEIGDVKLPNNTTYGEGGQMAKFDKEAYGKQQENVEDTEDIEAELMQVQTLDTQKNVVRGIQIPVKQEIYDETFAEFRKLLDSGADVGFLFLSFLKNENSKNK